MLTDPEAGWNTKGTSTVINNKASLASPKNIDLVTFG